MFPPHAPHWIARSSIPALALTGGLLSGCGGQPSPTDIQATESAWIQDEVRPPDKPARSKVKTKPTSLKPVSLKKP